MLKKGIIAVALLAVIGLGVAWFSQEPLEDQRIISVVGQTLFVDVADTVAEHVQGLSGRESLRENEGMLFVYPDSRMVSFWMKEMRFPIDMVWIDENKTVVGIEKNISPDTFPQLFSPAVPVRFVLELQANWADRHGLASGSQLSW